MQTAKVHMQIMGGRDQVVVAGVHVLAPARSAFQVNSILPERDCCAAGIQTHTG